MNAATLLAMIVIDCTSLMCFTYLASKFGKWWIALFALLFFMIPR